MEIYTILTFLASDWYCYFETLETILCYTTAIYTSFAYNTDFSL